MLCDFALIIPSYHLSCQSKYFIAQTAAQTAAQMVAQTAAKHVVFPARRW
jgi:hypothetical protein